MDMVLTWAWWTCAHNLRPNQHDFSRPTAIEELVGLDGLVQRKAVRDQILQRHTALDHEIRHLGQAAETKGPGAVDGQLLVDDLRADVKGGGIVLADEADFAPSGRYLGR
jgi:hypothetical protein